MGEPSATDRSDAEVAIMEATYRALCTHGYAALTMQDIADEYGKTTAAIHYYYDTKAALFASFLEFLLDRFLANVHAVETGDPAERLALLLDQLLADREEYRDIMVAMLELCAQAPYDESVQRQFRRNDADIRGLLAATVREGVEAGVFEEADPERVARALMTVVDGARTRFVVLDDPEALAVGRRAAANYVESALGVAL